jgi:O-antigen ligase
MAAFGGAGAMTVVVPGLLGTIKSFFVNADDDPSIEGRTEDVETVISYFREAPFFGRGTGTFTPALYDFLDNQFFMHLIETGAVGMLGLIFFMVVAIWTARQVRRWTIVRDRPTADLAQALVACIAVHFFTFATYDALSFRITGMSLFLIVGAAGALWRLERPVVEFATTEGR